jgi:hypothetical protein
MCKVDNAYNILIKPLKAKVFLFFVSISYLNKTIHQKKSQLNESALISK